MFAQVPGELIGALFELDHVEAAVAAVVAVGRYERSRPALAGADRVDAGFKQLVQQQGAVDVFGGVVGVVEQDRCAFIAGQQLHVGGGLRLCHRAEHRFKPAEQFLDADVGKAAAIKQDADLEVVDVDAVVLLFAVVEDGHVQGERRLLFVVEVTMGKCRILRPQGRVELLVFKHQQRLKQRRAARHTRLPEHVDQRRVLVGTNCHALLAQRRQQRRQRLIVDDLCAHGQGVDEQADKTSNNIGNSFFIISHLLYPLIRFHYRCGTLE